MLASLFRSITSPDVAATHAGAFDAFAFAFREPASQEIAKADLALWSPASFRNERRSTENVEAVHALTLDVDEAPIPDAYELVHALSGLRAVAYSSSSATHGAPRWRASIALSRPVTAGEYPRISAVVTSRLPFPVGRASKDPARAWFWPREGVDGTYEWISIAGEPLDVDALLLLAPAAPEASGPRAVSSLEAQHYPGDVEPGTDEHTRRRGLYAEYLRDEAPARGPDRRGQGDQILFEVVQRGAFDLSLPVDDVLELVAEHYDPRCDPPWGDELEERVHHKARDAKTRSTRPRAEPLPAELAHLGKPRAAPAESGTRLAAPIANDTADDVTFEGETWGGWDQAIAPPVYLLEGLIPEGKVCTFFAEGGSLKSWAAFSLAISVATGAAWLGRYAVKQGKVLILDYEDGRYEFQRRMRILRGTGSIPDLGYVYGGPSIETTALWAKLGRKVIRERIRLIVIDTLGSAMPGDADENTTAFAAAVKMAGRLTELGCTVVIVAHANKSGGLRGTSAIRDSSDVAFRFEPVSETDSIRRMRMVCDKPGPQKRPAPVNVELSDEGLRSFDDAPTPAASKGGATTLLDAARLAIELRGSIAGSVELGMLLGCIEKAARVPLRVLEESGEVIRGRDRRLYWGDDASQRKRILAAVTKAGTRTLSIGALAKWAAARPSTIEDMISERLVNRSSATEAGHFFLTK